MNKIKAAKQKPVPLNGQLPRTFAEAADMLPTMTGKPSSATEAQIDRARQIVYGSR